MNTFYRADWTGRFAAGCALLALSAPPSRPDASAAKKRAQLASVKRVAVVPLFFATEQALKLASTDRSDDKDAPPTEPPKPSAEPPKAPAEPPKAAAEPPKPSAEPSKAAASAADARQAKYYEMLRRMEAKARTRLPERFAARTPYQIIPAEELAAALKDLKLTPVKMFQNSAVIRGTRFAPPDPQAVRRLAERLKADAVLLGELDEPRRVNGHYYFDANGPGYAAGYAKCRAGLYLLLADGTEILHHYLDVLHPVTRLGNRDFVEADWTEAQEQVIEYFMDETTRYTPPKG